MRMDGVASCQVDGKPRTSPSLHESKCRHSSKHPRSSNRCNLPEGVSHSHTGMIRNRFGTNQQCWPEIMHGALGHLLAELEPSWTAPGQLWRGSGRNCAAFRSNTPSESGVEPNPRNWPNPVPTLVGPSPTSPEAWSKRGQRSNQAAPKFC